MSEIPDSISHQELLERFRQAAQGRATLPRATTLPDVPICREGGMLDLTMVIEQVTLNAEGVSIIQMLHLAGHLIDVSLRGLEQVMDQNLCDRDALAMAAADRAILQSVQGLFRPLLSRCSESIGRARKRDLESLGYQGRALHRRVFVSDAILQALGMDRDQYDAYFRSCLDDRSDDKA